jgi:hypothetical protein
MFDNWEDLLYNLHQQMEDEILQTINTANQNTIVIMFEDLREWLTEDSRLQKEPNVPFLIKKVADYNERINNELEQKLDIEVKKFQSTNEFKTIGENVEYEKEVVSFMGLMSQRYLPYKVKTINRKYYCNELSADFIDYFQIPKYIDLVKRIVHNFRSKIEKHLALYDAGKYISLAQINIERESIKNIPNSDRLIEIPMPPDEIIGSLAHKIDVDLNLEQLLYLFKALHIIGVVKNKYYTEIFDVLSEGFQLASKKPGENISKAKMANAWNKIDAKFIGYWKDKFIELMNQAKKDNPNNIKYNTK